MSLFAADRSAELTPVAILTGFLGSGKTTLLNGLLRQRAFGDTAVIMNEFGEIGLDHLLVERVDGETVLLQSGCVCCATRSDLESAVRRLLAQRDDGSVPPFRRILIETSGLADPAPVMQMVLANPLVAHFCTLAGVVATLDAPYGAQHVAELPEARKQIALADRVVLTKLDLEPQARGVLESAVRGLNRAAPMVAAVKGDIPADEVFPDRAGSARPELGQREHDEHAHTHGVRSLALTAEAPLDWLAVQAWFAELRAAFGPQLLRVKGILNLADEPQPVVVHGVHHVFHPPERLAGWPDEDRRSRLVFIVHELDPAPIRESFARLGA